MSVFERHWKISLDFVVLSSNFSPLRTGTGEHVHNVLALSDLLYPVQYPTLSLYWQQELQFNHLLCFNQSLSFCVFWTDYNEQLCERKMISELRIKMWISVCMTPGSNLYPMTSHIDRWEEPCQHAVGSPQRIQLNTYVDSSDWESPSPLSLLHHQEIL